MNHRFRVFLLVMLGVFACCSRAVADEPKEAEGPGDSDAAYRKAGSTWREVTDRGILPTDFQYLRDQIGWREAVLSYMRDGPGIFSVAPDRRSALGDRALMYVIGRDGFEVTQTEFRFIGRLLDQGAREPIKSYATFMRLRRQAELMYASDRLMEDLQKKELEPEHRQFLVDALTQIEHRLERLLLERKKADPLGGLEGRNQKVQTKLVQKKLAATRAFLVKLRPVEGGQKPKKGPADSQPSAK